MKRTIVQEFGEANRPPLVRGYANAKVGQQTKKSKLLLGLCVLPEPRKCIAAF